MLKYLTKMLVGSLLPELLSVNILPTPQSTPVGKRP
jgi:hypothetical protein